nr:peptidoglycan-binding protein [Streptomyces bauhiniae]
MRARPTDALAELMRELMPEPGEGLRNKPPAEAEEDTEELPPVPAEDPAAPRPRRRRWAVAVALAAAVLVGFGCALLLPGRQVPTAHPAPSPVPSAPSEADPDGPGTLRRGDSGPEVSELRRRLLRIPDVFHDGSATGPYDTQLVAAVARFQLWYGIRGDESGVYGDDTRRDLESRTGLG